MIPNFKEMMFPILGFFADGEIHNRADIYNFAARHFKPSQEDMNVLNKDGQPTFNNRADWALTYMATLGKDKSEEAQKVYLIDRVERGKYKISDLGAQLAKDEKAFKEWVAKVHGKNFFSNLKESSDHSNLNSDNTPDESLNSNLNELDNIVKSELLERILDKEPRFFEYLALRLLEKIGYGVTRGNLTQNGADGGIDGVIDEDALGFSKIYIQAKRFGRDAVVSRPEIQKFVGVLSTKPTKKGLFITTARFSKDACDFVEGLQGFAVVLIDGERLLDLMLRYKLGVQVREIKEIFAVDNDFFDEENY